MNFTLPDIHAAQKTAILSDWAEDERGRQRLTLSLDIDGTTVEGLFLRATAIRSLPDQEVMFQLEYRPPYKPGDQLCRIDWRPLRPHRNGAVGPKAYRLMEITGSHHHSFKLNWIPEKNQMRLNNLPIAAPISPDPSDFYQLLVLVSREFNIDNLSAIPLPAWDLLL